MGCPCKDESEGGCPCKKDMEVIEEAMREVIQENNELASRVQDLQRAVYVLASEMIR